MLVTLTISIGDNSKAIFRQLYEKVSIRFRYQSLKLVDTQRRPEWDSMYLSMQPIFNIKKANFDSYEAITKPIGPGSLINKRQAVLKAYTPQIISEECFFTFMSSIGVPDPSK